MEYSEQELKEILAGSAGVWCGAGGGSGNPPPPNTSSLFDFLSNGD